MEWDNKCFYMNGNCPGVFAKFSNKIRFFMLLKILAHLRSGGNPGSFKGKNDAWTNYLSVQTKISFGTPKTKLRPRKDLTWKEQGRTSGLFLAGRVRGQIWCMMYRCQKLIRKYLHQFTDTWMNWKDSGKKAIFTPSIWCLILQGVLMVVGCSQNICPDGNFILQFLKFCTLYLAVKQFERRNLYNALPYNHLWDYM